MEARIAALKEQERSLEDDKAGLFERPAKRMNDLVQVLFDVQRLDQRVRTTRLQRDDEIEELQRTTASVEQARLVLQQARERLVPLDDFLSSDEVEAIRMQASATEALDDAGANPEPLIVRRTGDTADFAWVIGMSEAQARRYLTKSSDWRMFFDDEPGSRFPKGVERPSPRQTVIRFEELPLDRYPSEAVERLRWLMSQPSDTKLPGQLGAAASEPA